MINQLGTKFRGNNVKKVFGALLLFLFPFFTQAQSPYELKPSTDYSLIGIGALSLTVGTVLENNTTVLSVSDINDLNPNDINSFDRNAIYNYSESARKTSDILLYGSLAAPLALLLDKKIRNDWVTVGVMGIEVLMITYGVTSSTKASVLRTRPYAYNPNVDLEIKQEPDARYSFFSGHTAVSASVTFFAAKVYADTHPNSKWKPLVWAGAVVIPAATGWARVEAGKHFPTDVITGYAIGAAIGYFIPVLHLKKDDSKATLHLEPSMEGMALRLVF